MTGHNPTSDLLAGIPNATMPLPQLITAGQPTHQQLARLAAAGYRTVLDLRKPEEPRGFAEAEAVQTLGMEYVSLPVSYEGLDDATFNRFRTLLRDRARRPIIVHCQSASRVGALLIPYLMLDQGRDREAAFELACAVGLRSAPLADAAFTYAERAGAP